MHLVFILPLLVVLALVSIGWTIISCSSGIVFSAYRNIWLIVKLKDVCKRKNRTQTPNDDDEADVTLVDESVSQVIIIKETESSCILHSSPVLSASQSAPVFTSVDESRAVDKDSDSSSSVPVYIPVSQSAPAIVSATVDNAEFGEVWTAPSTPVLPQDAATPSSSVDVPAAISPLKTGLNPSVAPFVPSTRSTATPPTAEVVPLPIIVSPEDWRPVQRLSFQWARGGCPTRITAPPAPAPLNHLCPNSSLKLA
ncbi:hypothetical protein B0H13DRAFT_86470 [Mycena leptocephala]|nr:hypothetical protein B0H13DRAFT_86470 [Mycena leptocephala]